MLRASAGFLPAPFMLHRRRARHRASRQIGREWRSAQVAHLPVSASASVSMSVSMSVCASLPAPAPSQKPQVVHKDPISTHPPPRAIQGHLPRLCTEALSTSEWPLRGYASRRSRARHVCSRFGAEPKRDEVHHGVRRRTCPLVVSISSRAPPPLISRSRESFTASVRSPLASRVTIRSPSLRSSSKSLCTG